MITVSGHAEEGGVIQTHLKPGRTADPAALVAWINERVGAKYQRIRDAVIYDEFPRNVAGKTLKREMRAAYEATVAG